ncbi:hypothetical protein I5559_07490 [Acinetobacter oleivorans]|uniref:PIN-like domain-containing protein n=1 Tax=Acinetobacter oleivorans TaxID=1148157 RepID=UPI0019009BE3|nr:PIN-like domain-containing protein [Acinetobacter oleivorans]MBJ9420235.1 hypothetical protein [Acinetobacter oleivorans]
MQNKFSCFYHPTENTELKNIWEDPETVFIFDTNVLLSLYSFQPEGRQDFFKILSKIKSRIWIPFHVGLEFQKNRLNVIKKRRNSFNDLNKEIDKLIDTIKFDKKPFSTISNVFSLKKNYQPVQEKLDTTLSEISKLFKELDNTLKFHLKEIKDEVKALDKDRIFINSDDFIRKEIDKLFDEKKVGSNTFDTQEKLEHLYKEGERRYENGIPPGYKDISKDEEEFFFDGLNYKRKFGDLIIFKQIIEFSKERNVKNIIFVSEDVKEDWRSIEEFEGTKILGARPELKRELNKEASVENFLIYQIEEFIQKTNDYLDIKIELDTLKSIKLSLEEEKRMYDEHLRIQRMNIEQLKAQEALRDHVAAQRIVGREYEALRDHIAAQQMVGSQLKEHEILMRDHVAAQRIVGREYEALRDHIAAQQMVGSQLKEHETLMRGHVAAQQMIGKEYEALRNHIAAQHAVGDQLKAQEIWRDHIAAQQAFEDQIKAQKRRYEEKFFDEQDLDDE